MKSNAHASSILNHQRLLCTKKFGTPLTYSNPHFFQKHLVTKVRT
uniref:Uncharacterized protein n=1 Tax=Rhizophora mucronata TaxID=61149 RepID=A0A2P2N8S3_RHIMU